MITERPVHRRSPGGAEPAPRNRMALFRAYLALTKPQIVELLLVTTIPAMMFAAGGWPDPFFYAHEGIELAWRVWDSGATVHYAGDLVAGHPLTEVTRHADFYWRNARNRVWLARRNLPWAVGVPYLTTWTAVQVVRSRHAPRTLRPWFRGWVAGWRESPGARRPLSWRTVWRMTRLGRPPVV